ncbi:sugar phosphate isomerase/epimerase family protein [Paenibacillus sp. GCM10023252]|uniref:sugar phosphate isomerase/epimerase family protein n=1 Tax=Paenibacillus sp. GCM10023252 TaxID=3252649 RepID=UPI0036176F3A
MLKLAYSTLPCEGWTVQKLIGCCLENGYTGIELKEDANYAITLETSQEELEAASRQFREAGIAVTNIGTRVRFSGAEDHEEARLLELKRTIDIAGTLGAKGVRIMLGNHFKYKSAPPLPLNRERIIELVREACDYGLPRGVEVWIETHNEFSTGAVLRHLLDEIGRSNCKVVYDIIHPYEFGESPEVTIRLLGEACAHVHLKDGVPPHDPDLLDWKYTLTGEGQLPIASIVAILQDSGYNGYYSLEWEPKWRPELRELPISTEEVISRYTEFMSELAAE